jgi:hypothetical protein
MQGMAAHCSNCGVASNDGVASIDMDVVETGSFRNGFLQSV